ncbi:MAG TPA: N-acetyl-gamma-glutamyl-phosphate reductase [Chitinophagaceae bacterium]|nr:N-acetyl-gamma-glutamyl-phosphate reductase [Chitinophagaceae bacterium]
MRHQEKNRDESKGKASAQVVPTSRDRKGAIRAGIIGGAGYAGGELIRLLIHHPYTSVSFIHSRSNAGRPVSSIHQDLLGEIDLKFTNKLSGDIDVLFLCVGHGEAKKFLEENDIHSKTRVIDLSQDFRLLENAKFKKRNFIYGLPELNREQIRSAENIANPGCFATGIQLGLLPLAKAGLLEDIYTTGITGSTGAGQGLTTTSHFSWRANNIQAYKTLTHQHLNEIYQSLHVLQKSFPGSPSNDDGSALSFIPWRGDFTRGIFISSQITCTWKIDKLVRLFQDFYAGHPYTFLSQDIIFLKQVVNTNKCVIQLEKVGTKLVIHSAIDNLLKGASGQAVQNMNLMFGLDECVGLNLKGSYF